MIVRVRLNDDGALTRIDEPAAVRSAMALRDYVEAADPYERARFDYDRSVGALINGVIGGTLAVPISVHDKPYDFRAQREGWEPELPPVFSELYADLVSRLTGSPAVSSLSTHRTGRYVFGRYRERDDDGTVWELCWFED